MNMLTGLVKSDSGIIEKDKNLKIGFVFQDYRRNLLPWLTVKENILFPLKLQNMEIKRQEILLKNLLEKLKISIPFDQHVFTLSGGQAQLISLLRALIIKPDVLILDEPFSALDYSLTLSFYQKLQEIVRVLNLTTLFISHNLDEALYLGDKAVFLTQKPTSVLKILDVPFKRPREISLMASFEFAKLKREALKIIETCAEGLNLT